MEPLNLVLKFLLELFALAGNPIYAFHFGGTPFAVLFALATAVIWGVLFSLIVLHYLFSLDRLRWLLRANRD